LYVDAEIPETTEQAGENEEGISSSDGSFTSIELREGSKFNGMLLFGVKVSVS